MYVCISQTCLKSHSLSSKVFSEIVHFLECYFFYPESFKHFRQAGSFIKASVRQYLFFYQMIALEKLI